MKRYVLLVMILVQMQNYAQMGISANGSAPDTSAMLDVNSTTSGLLIPRMQAVERDAISSPATGLIVYVKDDNSFYYFDGTSWVQLAVSGNAWLLTGNAGTNTSQFLGTTDNMPLVMKTNNVERVRIKENGVIGINSVPNDDYLLSVIGNTYTRIGSFIGERTNSNDVGVYGDVSVSDYYGTGGYFKGGYKGVLGTVSPTGSNYYYGVSGIVNGGTGVNYGVYSNVSGDGTNLGYTSIVNGTGTDYGFYVSLTGTGTRYGFISSSAIPNDKGSIAYLSNSDDTGIGLIALGSNVSNYYTPTTGAAITATGKLITVAAYSDMDDNSAVMLLGKYKGTTNTDATGVRGYSVPADNYGYGVQGFGGYIGVYGRATNGFTGIYGYSDNSTYAIFANGDTGASGTKSFVIDHPLDPENKILKHFSVESNEILNVYRGVEILDLNGRANVELPSYFSAINRNFSYLLTPIGSSAPNLYIENEINNGVFTIAGGSPGLRVSWCVYAERNDLYLQENPDKRDVEISKTAINFERYVNPDLYEKDDSQNKSSKVIEVKYDRVKPLNEEKKS